MLLSTHKLTAAATLLFVIPLLSGCRRAETLLPANELVFEVSGINEVAISYDEENVTLFPSDSGQLIIREYMSPARNRYYARVTEKNNTLHISEGGKPINRIGFKRYVEVYIPAAYAGDIILSSTSGTVELSDLHMQIPYLKINNTSGKILFDTVSGSQIDFSTTSGQIEGNSIHADHIALKTTSGSVSCQRLEGMVTYASTSGNITVHSAVGSGVYETGNSGLLDITYDKVTGDLTLSNKNDDVSLTIPDDLEFTFEAQSKNGAVHTDFQKWLTLKDGAATGTIGVSPDFSISLTTHDGDIHVYTKKP